MNTQTAQWQRNTMRQVVQSAPRVLMLGIALAAVILLFPSAARSKTQEWTVYNTTNSGIPDNCVATIGIDPHGNIWTGHSHRWEIGGGCAKFDGKNWTVYNTSNSGLPHNNVMAFAFDQQDNVWIAMGSANSTGGGLVKFDGTHWTHYYTGNSGLPHNNVVCLAFAPDGSLWMGTNFGGMARFDGTNWTTYNTSNSGLPDNQVTDLAFDSLGNLWAGTWGGGLAKFDGENWIVYNASNSGLPHNRIVPVVVDPRDNIWVGMWFMTSTERGLVKFDGVNWTNYHTHNSGLTGNGICALAVDSHGSLWIGPAADDNPAAHGGLAGYDGEKWLACDTSNSGLPGNWMYSLAVDDQGGVWIGTQNAGLAVYRPRPAVDLNNDETVDIHDLLLLIESWGQDDPLTDIVPAPFGDDLVDEKDLEALMGYWGQEVLDRALLAYWKLDEIAGETAYGSAVTPQGVTYDGTLHGGPAWEPMGGWKAGALQFDGLDDYVETSFVLDPPVGPFSVFAWIKGGASGQVIVSQWEGQNCLMVDPAGRFSTEMRHTRISSLVSQAIIADDQWHQIGLVWNGEVRTLYVDRVEVARDAKPIGAPPGVLGRLQIGTGKGLELGSFWSGLIDDVRIYNRAVMP